MKKVILIPDSFKGTMSSAEICAVMSQAVRTYYPAAEVFSIPVADGGEGSVDSFLAAVGGEKITLTVPGPYFEPMESFYGILSDGKTAVIEMAACAGLPLVYSNKDPRKTTTFGVGHLMKDAALRGCTKIVVGLGGSCTNDGGTGAAAALGVRFYDGAGNEFVPVGGTVKDIEKIDLSGRDRILDGVEIVTMCDIDNPLYGPTGASHIFGPQKGADPAMVEELDSGLRHLSEVMKRELGLDLSEMPGGGAAGGMGAGMRAFFGSTLQMGIETVLDTVDFDRLLEGADMVFTGEGKIDTQSLRGKVAIGVARRCAAKGVPAVAVVGDIGDNIEAAYDMGISAVFSINRVAVPFSEAKPRSQSDLALTMDNLIRFFARLGL